MTTTSDVAEPRSATTGEPVARGRPAQPTRDLARASSPTRPASWRCSSPMPTCGRSTSTTAGRRRTTPSPTLFRSGSSPSARSVRCSAAVVGRSVHRAQGTRNRMVLAAGRVATLLMLVTFVGQIVAAQHLPVRAVGRRVRLRDVLARAIGGLPPVLVRDPPESAVFGRTQGADQPREPFARPSRGDVRDVGGDRRSSSGRCSRRR